MGAVIDHLIYGVRDLDAAAARLADLGLSSYFGGTHPGLGTSNRIVPLGQSYIELLAPAPFERDRFVGWMLRGVPLPDDALPMERVREDGTVLRWRLSGLTAPSVWEIDPLAPVFIEWGEGVDLPGSTDPIGTLEAVVFGPRGIESAAISTRTGLVEIA